MLFYFSLLRLIIEFQLKIIPSEEEGLVRGGAPLGKGDGGIRKNYFFNGKKRCQ